MITPSDIVKHLRVYLPWHSQSFCDFFDVNYGNWDPPHSAIMTFNTAHGLALNDLVVVKKMRLKNPIVIAGRTDDYGYVDFFDYTDVTLPGTITIIDAAAEEWNGEKTIVDVQRQETNRTRITFLPRPETDPEYPPGKLLEDRPTFRGLWTVTNVPEPTRVEIIRPEQPDYLRPNASVRDVEMYSAPRIVVAPDFERAIELYTAQASPDSIWAYVIPTGRRTSTDRTANTDALAEFGPDSLNRLYSLWTFSVVVVVDTTRSISAGAAMDLMHGDIYTALLASIFGFRQTTCGRSFGAVPTSDAILRYTTSYLAHSFDFEMTQVIDFTDGFNDPQDFAANQIEYIQHPGDIENPETLKSIIKTRG